MSAVAKQHCLATSESSLETEQFALNREINACLKIGGIYSLPTEHLISKPMAVNDSQPPAALPDALQQQWLKGAVKNPFRAHFPAATDNPTPKVNAALLKSLRAFPLNLDDNPETLEWLAYTHDPAAGEPPYFWVIQQQMNGDYQIMLEHAGEMVWVSTETTQGHQNLLSSRFGKLDASGRTGTFTDLRTWQYQNGNYGQVKAAELATGLLEQPQPAP